MRADVKTDAQRMALDSEADILLFGGAAGSLKTFTLLMDMAQEVDLPRMKAVIFRRSYPELEEIVEQSRDLYPHMGGLYNETKHTWRFPAGGTIKFRFIEREQQMYRYQGAQFSAIGFDESTHMPMKVIRYLFTRARSTDSNLKVRMRLATNPGNVSHQDHKKMFLRGYCFHCHPNLSAEPGKLYWDTCWPDGVPLSDEESGIKYSTAFIPGRLTDHNLLGSRYIQQLRMQNPATAKALLAGCWEIFEGQYFDVWDARKMVRQWQGIGYEWWWPHWISCDYGFTISAAAASLWCRRPPFVEDFGNGHIKQWPKGKVYKLSEIVKAHYNAPAMAQEIINKWLLAKDGSRLDRRIQAMYLSPDVGKDIGVVGKENIHTVKGQMNKLFEPFGLAFSNAANDRIGGAMHLYNGLNSGELIICQNCQRTLEMFPTRIHDPKKENDVLKVKGDPLDDVYDDTRYGYYSPEFEERKPKEEAKMEIIAQGLEPLSEMIRLKQVDMDYAEEEGPIAYGGKALRQRLDRKQRGAGKIWRSPRE